MPASARRTSAPRNRSAYAVLASVWVCAALLATTASAGTARHIDPPALLRRTTHTAPSLFDVRAGTSVAPAGRAADAQASLAASLGPQGVLELDDVTGTPRVVARLDGFLTGPSDATPEDVALGFVRENLAAFALSSADLGTLRLVRDYVDILGTHHLTWVQTVDGVPVWDHDLRAHVTADGSLVAITGSPLPDIRSVDTTPELRARDAISAAYRSVGSLAPPLGAARRMNVGPTLRTTYPGGDDARLVLFGTGRGATLAWRTTSFVADDEIDVSIVDDASGDVLYRSNLVKSDQMGTGQAWESAPSPDVANSGGVQRTVSFPVASAKALKGNNAWAYLDTDDDNRPDTDMGNVPATNALDWNYVANLVTDDGANNCSTEFPCTWDKTTPFSWQTNAAQNAVQVYHYLNEYHDHLLAEPIGFTEAAGNFQTVNGSGQGQGGDAVEANVLDGANTSNGLPDSAHKWNANMSTFPDGRPPLMQMYLFPAIAAAGTPSANGGDDASVVYHEYTHGLSSRLITHADGSEALDSAEAGAMGEAWSDFYAMDYLVSSGYETDGAAADLILGRYISGGKVGLLRYDAIDCDVADTSSNCPGGEGTGPGGFTLADFGHVYTGPEVHSDGEIWGQTLWDLRTALGSPTALMIITRAMELSPPEPSFLDMRNAIIEADRIAFGGANEDAIWQVFAERGMGFFAAATDGSDTTPSADFSTPPSCPASCGSISGTITDRMTGRPIRGIRVGLAGHSTGFLGDLADVTSRNGQFAIADVPFHTYVLTVSAPGYETTSKRVRVDADEDLSIHVTRDWAALDGGAKLRSATPPDYSQYGCGPELAFDGDVTTGWGSDTPNNRSSGVARPRSAVVRLPTTIDVTSFGFATGGTCGDGHPAAVRAFSIQTRRAHGRRWTTAYTNTRSLSVGVMHTLRPDAGTDNVRYVRVTMRSSSGDRKFMDMLELSVRGAPA